MIANNSHLYDDDAYDDINFLTCHEINDLFDFDGEKNDEININKNKNCSKCGTDIYLSDDTKSGNCVCSDCGTVFGEIIDNSAGWTCFDDENKSDNVGGNGITCNELLPQSSLSTTIRGGSNRLKTIQNWSIMPYRERSLNVVYKMIKKICEKNGIIRCVEIDAQIMYKTLSDCRHVKGKNKGKFIIIRGSNRISLIAACIFNACRNKGITRSPKEIAEMFEMKHVKMTNGCKMFTKLSNIKKISMSKGISLAEHFIKRFCDDLKIREPFISQTIKIAKNIKRLNMASKHIPFSIAVGSILLMTDINKMHQFDKKFIAEKFNVSSVTIDKTLSKIKHHVDILVSDEKTNKVFDIMEQKKKEMKIPQIILDKQKKFGIINNNGHDNENKQNLIDENLEFEICEEYLLDDNYDADDLELCDDNEYFKNLRQYLTKYEINSVTDIDEYLDIVGQLNDNISYVSQELNISHSSNIVNKLMQQKISPNINKSLQCR